MKPQQALVNRRRGRAVVGLLVVLFAAPLVAAYGLYYGAGWRGDGEAAAGRLVRPIVAVPPASRAALTGRWTLLQLAPHGCDARCKQHLHTGRVVRGLLHVDAARVRQVLVVGDNTPAETLTGLQPDVTVYRTKVEDWQALFSARMREAPGTIYLIDPEARWMAYYPPSIGADGLHQDLKRLLALASRP
tara:strand:- start:7144 stop:7710 length:567 start_codon:yes stop_codon:yes gene_type:complete